MFSEIATIIKSTFDYLASTFNIAVGFIGIMDIIDVIIVAYLIYRGAKLIQETRAEQLIKGIIVLVVITWLSQILRLTSLHFILTNTMQFGVLTLLVVFQPEMRRALEQVGRSKFSNFFNFEDSEKHDVDVQINEVVKAIVALSKEKTGALIVIERDTKIGDTIRTGIEIEAKLSSELLINIFIPNTPLHDGAVVLRGLKIKAAGCFLPLTQVQDLSTELGTRHRAAIGMTENSDAVVVVVSEETGKISISTNGTLSRDYNEKTLKSALHSCLAVESESKVRKNILRWKGRSG